MNAFQGLINWETESLATYYQSKAHHGCTSVLLEQIPAATSVWSFVCSSHFTLQFSNHIATCNLEAARMKTSTIVALFFGLVSATLLDKRSCSVSLLPFPTILPVANTSARQSQCVEKVVQVSGCAANDFSCSCSKPGMIKQLQPCLEFACDSTALEGKSRISS